MCLGGILTRLYVLVKKCRFYFKELRFSRSYSQLGEDLLLRGFLGDKWSWNYRGLWVDIGAHHPRMLSNTMAFYNPKRVPRGHRQDHPFSPFCYPTRESARIVPAVVGSAFISHFRPYDWDWPVKRHYGGRSPNRLSPSTLKAVRSR